LVRPDKPRRHCERSGALVARGWLASVRSSFAPAESDDIHRQDCCEFSSFETRSLLQGVLHIVPPSRNVRFLRIAVVPSLPSNYRNPHEAAIRVLQSYVRFGETAQPRWMATMGAKRS
jgi:hypothetical protein